jgi:hypothetical protein
VDLYASSSTYPLSQRIFAAGRDRAYFHHSATALVNAADGRTVIVADSAHDPMAATWMRRFPSIFRRPTAFASALRQLQPPRESARAQATVVARFGLPGENIEGGKHLPDDVGADSALAGDDAPLIGIPALDATAMVIPLVDRAERVRGLFIATGGASRRSIWWRLADGGPSWGESLDRLHAMDTVSAPQVVRGSVRAVPVAGGVALVQPRYDWNGGDRPRLRHLSVLDADTVRTLAQLLDLAPAPVETRPVSAPDFRTRVAALYAEMRRALARGDWVAYGRAFNELGTLLSRSRE